MGSKSRLMPSAESSLWNLIPLAWRAALAPQRVNVAAIGEFLHSEAASGRIANPVPSQIFAALMLSPEDVKVVIVGQDPYPNNELAIGKAFAVPQSIATLPGSLRNILQECKTDLGVTPLATNDLSSWGAQGVLLLNRCLTTRQGESHSHNAIGWQEFTNEVIAAVRARNPEVIGVLWGKSAQELAISFDSRFVVVSAHPSPLSAHRGFLGSRPFSKVNGLLVSQGRKAIEW